MPRSTVLITGASGFVGYHILLGVLREGYSVRVVVRSDEKAESILKWGKRQRKDITAAKMTAAFKSGKLTFVKIPDLSTPGVWDEPLQGVDFIIHAASPLPYPGVDPHRDVYLANKNATDNLFRATLNVPTLKRVVVTSSVVATMPRRHVRDSGPFTVKTVQLPTPGGPFTSGDDAYQVSKIYSLNASQALILENNPKFDLINILSGHTLGIDHRAYSPAEMASSSNGIIVDLLSGATLPEKVGVVAHIDDVVTAHVKALDPKTRGNQDYAVGVPAQYNDIIAIAKRTWPDVFEAGLLSDAGHLPTEVVTWDTSPTEVALDFKFQSLDDMIEDAGAQYVTMLKRAQNEA